MPTLQLVRLVIKPALLAQIAQLVFLVPRTPPFYSTIFVFLLVRKTRFKQHYLLARHVTQVVYLAIIKLTRTV